MEIKGVISKENGIFKLECESHEEALAFLELVKEDYPYAVMNGTGYYSDIYILNLFATWGEFVTQEIAEDGQLTTCIHCDKCGENKKPSRNSSPGIASAPERCHTEQFWAEVVQEKQRHFVENGHVYSFTYGQGGFGGSRYNVEFEDGEVLTNVGLWHRGKVPQNIAHLFRKAICK